MAIEDRIKDIEEEISSTVYNKATQHHIGKLKAKLAQLKDEQVKRASSGGGGYGFAVKKSGHGTVALIGFPSVGKSTLLNQLTDAKSEVGDYEFTTLDVVPGMMEHNDTKIQILDLPGIITGASSGKGRGREILSIARNANLILILLDVFNTHHIEVIKKELYSVGIRLDKKPPNVSIRRTQKGGIILNSTVNLTKIDDIIVRDIMNIYGYHNAEVTVHEDLDSDELIDGILGNRIYTPSLVVVNKVDLAPPEHLDNIKEELGYFIPISANKGENLELVKDKILEKLDVIRIYMKPQGEKADMDEPLIIKRRSSVRNVCEVLHKEFMDKFRYARVWGKSARYAGQIVGLEHKLEDKDVLSVIKGN
ncbi:MAG: GTP-binding protein [Candidatus Altiarchaeales archaeon HGW-Altiarchaeales-3]|nr:MAG: GTP-binding protein [Candidatus Altiarchaeales archaeon HGW-Altiarchaeales-3]